MVIGIFAMALVLVSLDLWIKMWASDYLQSVGTIPLIDGVFHLTYVENRGAVAGILQGKQIFLIVVTAVILLALAAALLLKKVPGKILPWCFGLIIGGGIGNLIDRILYGYVRDFFYIVLIHFPIFNVADICVTGSAAAAVILLFTVYRNDDFTFLKKER